MKRFISLIFGLAAAFLFNSAVFSVFIEKPPPVLSNTAIQTPLTGKEESKVFTRSWAVTDQRILTEHISGATRISLAPGNKPVATDNRKAYDPPAITIFTGSNELPRGRI